MYGDGRIGGVKGVYKYEVAFHRAVFTGDMLIGCLERAGFSSVERVDGIPYKKKHRHEVCVRGVK